MRSKLLNNVMLTIAVFLDAALLLFVSNRWARLGFGLWLLLVIIVLASQLELGKVLGLLPKAGQRPRRFALLRATVTLLLAEVRRLNWLVVDLDRGFRNREIVSVEIETSERHLQELLKEVRKNAGKTDDGFLPDDELQPPPPSAMPVKEPGLGGATG